MISRDRQITPRGSFLRRGKKNHTLASVLHQGPACPRYSRLIDGRTRDNLLREQRLEGKQRVSAILCIYGPVGPVKPC